MPRARASVVPDAIRIEDEVWQEAFSERPRSRPRLRSLDGGHPPERPKVRAAPPAARRVSGSVAPRGDVAVVRSRPFDHAAGALPLDSAVTPFETPVISTPFDAPDLPDPPGADPLEATDPPPSGPSEPSESAAPGRRTVTITGRGAERNLPWPTEASRRRAAKRVHERAGFRPDRFAMWALLLGMLLVLVALTSAHG